MVAQETFSYIELRVMDSFTTNPEKDEDAARMS